MPKEKPNKQKVIFVITKSNLGGAQRYVYDLATNLPPDQYTVSVLCGGEGELIDKLRAAGISTTTLSFLGRDISVRDDIRSFFALIREFRSKKPDIVHLNSSKVGGIGALAARITCVPRIIFTAHGWAFNEDRSVISKHLIMFLHWFTLVLAHKTIAVSSAAKEQVHNFPFVQKKISIVHNGLREILFRTKEDARSAIGVIGSLPVNAFWIGMIAELHPIKGITYAIQALSSLRKEHPEAIIIVLGEGEARALLEGEIASQKLSSAIFLVGYRDQAATLLPAFDIFLLSSLSEALAYVVLEAGSAGLPVIATRVGGIPEIVEDGVSGILVPPRSPNAIAEALTVLIENKGKAAQYGVALKKKISEEFSLGQMVRKTIEVYTGTVNNKV